MTTRPARAGHGGHRAQVARLGNDGDDRSTTAVDPHLALVRDVTPGSDGCEDCLRLRMQWVHLRLCLTCGQVGCCDSSIGQHARRHAHAAGHPIARSFEPGEDWRWCFIHDAYV